MNVLWFNMAQCAMFHSIDVGDPPASCTWNLLQVPRWNGAWQARVGARRRRPELRPSAPMSSMSRHVPKLAPCRATKTQDCDSPVCLVEA